MPVNVTYPGVYIEEIPSGQHVITGVATSITAFIGRAVCGTTEEPITIFNYGDFESMFGGLSYNYPMSYAVRDFFLNGGSQAVIVRLFEKDTELTDEEWDNEGEKAAKDVIHAVGQVKVANTTKNEDVVKAAKAEAAKFKTDPGKSSAVYVVAACEAEAKKSGAKPQDVKDAAAKVDVFETISPYPNPKASMSLSSYTWANVLDGAQSVIQAASDSFYNIEDGVSIDPATPTPSSVYKIIREYVALLANDDNADVSSYARKLNLALKAPDKGDSLEKAINGIVDTVVATEEGFIPSSAKPSLDTYKSDIKSTLKGLFDSKGELKTDGKGALNMSMDTLTGKLDAVLDKLKKAVAVPSSILRLEAADAGSWGNSLSASVDYEGINNTVAAAYSKYSLKASDLFNLNVEYVKPSGQKVIERHTNVTVKKDTKAPNRLDLELLHNSLLVRVPVIDEDGKESPVLPDSRPPANAEGHGGGGSDGTFLEPLTYIGDESLKTGMYMLKKVDLFNLLCIPPDVRKGGNTDPAVYTEALTMCVDRRAMLIADSPTSWADYARTGRLTDIKPTDPDLGINGVAARNAAVYFPRVIEEDLEMNGQKDVFPASGMVAGVMAATDVARGVWKAPAGQNAGLMGIQGLEVNLTDDENGLLNPLGINCLRNFPIIGPVVWGARTMRGADQLSDDYKYLNVRRLTLYIEESLYRGSKWAVFEPNDETLWSSLRLSVGGFLADLQRQGAFYNYKVQCDSSTTTPDDIAKGIVNIVVQIAPVKPAEFVVIKIQQVAAKLSS